MKNWLSWFHAIGFTVFLTWLIVSLAFSQVTMPCIQNPSQPFCIEDNQIRPNDLSDRMRLGGDLAINGGQIILKALATPGTPTVTPQGTTGATSYGYKIIATNGAGTTAAGVEGTTATGNATLSATNFNRVTWTAVTNALGYKVYRTTGGATQGLIATLGTQTTLDDTGIAGGGEVAETTNTTALIEAEGSVADGFETQIIFTNPSADRTITVPDASGTIGFGGLSTTDIDTSAKLAAIVTDEVGTDNLVFRTFPTFLSAINLGDQARVHWLEGNAGGANYKAFGAPATLTADTVCIFEDDANFIPDSCVGDGVDGGLLSTNIDTSAELAAIVTDEVGTGALTFATAPTFTTSITAPLVIGGTATTSDLNLQTTTGIGAAGADMHFLVGNNGATEAMTILNGGNVGIGTTGPAEKLAIYGGNIRVQSGSETIDAKLELGNSRVGVDVPKAAIVADGLGSWSKADLYFVLDSADDDNPYNITTDTKMVIKNSGNVGIGTTGPASKLEVGVGNPADNTNIAKINTVDTDKNALTLSNWDGAGTTYGPRLHFDNSGRGEFYMGGSDGANNFDIARTWGTPDLRIDGSGYVGIGTATPQSTLHVPDGKYAQIEDNNAGAPPAADCDANAERGRLSIDTTNNRLYICNGATRLWDYVALAD